MPIIQGQEINKEIEPYYLEVFEDNKIKLTMDNEVSEGTYELKNTKEVYLNLEFITSCQLDDKNLNCDMYASTFKKQN